MVPMMMTPTDRPETEHERIQRIERRWHEAQRVEASDLEWLIRSVRSAQADKRPGL